MNDVIKIEAENRFPMSWPISCKIDIITQLHVVGFG